VFEQNSIPLLTAKRRHGHSRNAQIVVTARRHGKRVKSTQSCRSDRRLKVYYIADSGQASLADWNAPSEHSRLRSFLLILELAGTRQNGDSVPRYP
jgi:hypothetical protein